MARHCNECKSKLPSNAKFCMECGAQVPAATALTTKPIPRRTKSAVPLQPVSKRTQQAASHRQPYASLPTSTTPPPRQRSKVRRLSKTSSAVNRSVTPKESLRELAMQSLLSAAQRGTVPEQLLPYLNQLGIENAQRPATSPYQNSRPAGRSARPVKSALPRRRLRHLSDDQPSRTGQVEGFATPPDPGSESRQRKPRLRPISLASDRTLQSIMGHSRERGLYTSVAAAVPPALPKPRSGSRLLQRIQRQESASERSADQGQLSLGRDFLQAERHRNSDSHASSTSLRSPDHHQSNGHSIGDSDAELQAVYQTGVVQDELDEYYESDLSGMLRPDGEDVQHQDFSDLYNADLSAMLRRPALQERHHDDFLTDEVEADPEMSAMLRSPQQPLADPSDISAMFRRKPGRSRGSGSDSSSWQRPPQSSENGVRVVASGDSVTPQRDSHTSHSDVDALDLSDIMNRTRRMPSAAPTVGGGRSDTDPEFEFQQQTRPAPSEPSATNPPAASGPPSWPASSPMGNSGLLQGSSPSLTPPPMPMMVPAPVHPPFPGPPFSFSSGEMDVVPPSGPVTDSTDQTERFPDVTLPPPSDPGEITLTAIHRSEQSGPTGSAADTSEHEHWISPEELERRARQEALRDLFEQRFHQATVAIQKAQEPSEQKIPRQLARKISRLETIKVKETEQIAAALGDIGKTKSPAAVEILREYAEKGPLNVRAASIAGLAGIDHASARLGLLALLKDPSQDVVDHAMRGLINSGTTAAVPALVCLGSLNSRYATVLLESLQALHEQGVAAVAEPLKNELSGDNVHCASLALSLLTRLQGAETVKAATKLLKHPAPEMRVAALESLAYSKMKQSVRFFNASMRDADPQVRAAAATALGAVSSPKSASLLIAALHDKHQAVRRNAAKTLNRMEDPDRVIAAAASKAVADQTDPMTMEYLLEIVGKGGTDDALETLQRYLTDDNHEFRHRAINTLRKLKTPNAAPILRPFLSDPDHETRELAVRAIGSTGDKSVLPMLRQMLKSDQSDKVRAAAARSLGDLKDKKALTLLEEALHDVRLVACQAVIAMGSIGQKSSLPALFSQLRNNASEIRYHACNSLAEIGDTAAVPFLVPLLDDREAMVHRAAEAVLAKLGGGPTKTQRLAKRMRSVLGGVGSALIPSTVVSMIPGGTTGLLTVSGGIILAVLGFLGVGLLDTFGTPGANLPVTQVSAVAIAASGEVAFAGRSNGVGEFWDLKEGELLDRFKSPFSNAAIFSTAGDSVLLFSIDGFVKHQCSSRYRSSIEETKTKFGRVQGYCHPPEADVIWVCTADESRSELTEIDLGTLDFGKTKTIEGRIDGPFAINVSQTMLATATHEGIWLYTGESLKKAERALPLKILLGPGYEGQEITGLAFNSDDSLLAIVMPSGVAVLNLPAGDLKTVLFTEEAGRSRLISAQFMDTKNTLVAIGSSGRRFEATDDLTKVSATEGPEDVRELFTWAVTPDWGTAIFAEDEHKDLTVLDLQNSKPVHELRGKLD